MIENKNLHSSDANDKENKPYIELLKKLRDQTKLSFSDCKEAIDQSKGDESKALLILRSKSLTNATKSIDRKTKVGAVVSHVPRNRKGSPEVGVLLELSCETDFVSSTPEFLALAKKLALHVYEQDPTYSYWEDIPKEAWEATFANNLEFIKKSHPKSSLKEQETLAKEKTENELTKTVLTCQTLDDINLTVSEYIGSFIGLFRENIKVRRFARFSIFD